MFLKVNNFRCFRRLSHVYSKYRNADGILVEEEVRYALSNNQPVVALESTIITHGMPYPENIKCALDVEKEIRNQVQFCRNFFAA